MGLNSYLFATKVSNPNDLGEDLNHFMIKEWRKNYELNHWMYRHYQRKTGIFGRKYDIFDGVWFELTIDDLKKLRDDIICNRVRLGEYIHTSFEFVDIAMAKVRKGNHIFYLMEG